MAEEVTMHSDDELFIKSLWPTQQELNLRKTESQLDGYDSASHQSDDRNEVALAKKEMPFDATSVSEGKINPLDE